MDIRKPLTLFTIVILAIFGLEFVNLNTSQDKMIFEDQDSISVMTYSLLDRDSTIKRYHKDIIWNGYVVSKKNGWGYVPGYKGHWYYRCEILSDDQKRKIEINGDDEHIFKNVKNGMRVEVRESWWPDKRTQVTMDNHTIKMTWTSTFLDGIIQDR